MFLEFVIRGFQNDYEWCSPIYEQITQFSSPLRVDGPLSLIPEAFELTAINYKF